jgi:hypothetical protein
MSFPFVEGLDHFKALLAPDYPSRRIGRIAWIDSHQNIIISMSQNAKGRTTLPEILTEFTESPAYLVDGWICVVLEEEKGVPQKLLFLFPDRKRPLACKEGTGRLLFQLAVDTGGILQS